MLFLSHMLSPLAGSVCLHKGADCRHGDRCPVMASNAETLVCHTGNPAHEGQGHTAESFSCGMYLGSEGAGPGALNPLEMPFLAGRGFTSGPDRNIARAFYALPFFTESYAPANEEPPETSFIS